nr:RHS repeat-associated core domain-containing protein [Burkholderia sp. Ac-20365]
MGNGTRTELAYDDQGGLSTLNHRFTSSTEDWLATFTRNQLGDIRQANVTNSRYVWTSPVWVGGYSTNALNQYTTMVGKVPKSDLNGNLTNDGTWTYSYDRENHLRTAADRFGTTNATLAYDPEGRLLKTTVNGTDTTLLYDGQKVAAEYDAAGTMTRRYVFGPGVDAPLVQYEGSGTGTKSWLYANQQGSVVVQANAAGATTGSRAYGPFGETSGALDSRFGYTGQQYLASLGLYYYKARMYSPGPALGRFLQTDPVGYRDDLNWYAYVGNNPVNLTDPSGMIAAFGFASTTNYPSSSAANVSAQACISAPKLVVPTFMMPATATVNQAAVQVAAGSVPMTGNPPGGFRLNPNGLNTDYCDGTGNLTAQYHESHGESHGHNFFWTVNVTRITYRCRPYPIDERI